MNGVLRGLPVMDPRRAELRGTVLRAPTGRRIAGGVPAAQIASQPDRRGGWLRFESGAALALARPDDEACRFEAEDGLAAAALIECAEPFLRTIEMALGIDLEPAEVVAEPSAGALIVSVAPAGLAARMPLPLDLATLPAPSEFAPELVGKAAIRTRITITGPRLAPHEAADLAPGDCLLLGATPLPAELVAGTIRIAGSLDPRARQFRSRP